VGTDPRVFEAILAPDEIAESPGVSADTLYGFHWSSKARKLIRVFQFPDAGHTCPGALCRDFDSYIGFSPLLNRCFCVLLLGFLRLVPSLSTSEIESDKICKIGRNDRVGIPFSDMLSALILETRLLDQPSLRVIEGMILEFSHPADLRNLRRQLNRHSRAVKRWVTLLFRTAMPIARRLPASTHSFRARVMAV